MNIGHFTVLLITSGNNFYVWSIVLVILSTEHTNLFSNETVQERQQQTQGETTGTNHINRHKLNIRHKPHHYTQTKHQTQPNHQTQMKTLDTSKSLHAIYENIRHKQQRDAEELMLHSTHSGRVYCLQIQKSFRQACGCCQKKYCMWSGEQEQPEAMTDE